jgi:hypothetical protein
MSQCIPSTIIKRDFKNRTRAINVHTFGFEKKKAFEDKLELR